MNDVTITTDGKERIEIKSGPTVYIITVNQYSILRIHGEYTNRDGTKDEKTSIGMACIDRTTADVYLV